MTFCQESRTLIVIHVTSSSVQNIYKKVYTRVVTNPLFKLQIKTLGPRVQANENWSKNKMADEELATKN